MKRNKITFFVIISLFLLVYSNINFVFNPINSPGVLPVNDDDKLLKIDAIIENITGTCNQSLYNLYGLEQNYINYFQNTKNYTEFYPANVSLSNFDYNLTSAKVSISVTALTTEPEKIVVTENTTNHMNSTNQNVTKLAQMFTITNNSVHVTNFSFFLNYRCWLSWNELLLDLYRAENFNGQEFVGERINTIDVKATMPADRFFLTSEWINVTYNNLLTPGNYFAVLYFKEIISVVIPENNSWQVHEYNNSIYDNGTSMFQNSSGHWNNITNDTIRDFLMKIEISRYENPEFINLTCYINDISLDLITYEEPNPGFLRFPYTSYCDYYLSAPPDQDINFTLTTDKSLYFCLVFGSVRYIKFLNATGNFTTSLDRRRWTVNYTSINSTNTFVPFFLFPLDWSITEFYDIRLDREIIEYGLMYSKIYNKTYKGIYYAENGEGVKRFDYRAEFSSHNYVSKINPQVLTGGNFENKLSFKKGDKIRIQAIIEDSDSNPASSGNCSFYLYNPSIIQVKSFKNKSVINGVAYSGNITTSNLTEGEYFIQVIWKNGSEVGFNSFTFSISEEQKIFPFIPPAQPEPIWLYIITTALIVLTVMLGSLIAKRKLQERNWEKSLLHLFIMNKDGRAMYDYTFGVEQKDPTLISGMLTALTSFIKETVGSKKQLKTIDQEDKKVILGHGTYSTVAVFAEKDLPIIHNKTSEFLTKFEDSFSSKIKHWDGSISIFKGVGSMVEKYFPISKEAKIIQGVGKELLLLKESISSSSDPQEVISLLQKVTGLAERYQEIIREHFNKEYGEILKIANQKVVKLV